MWEDEAQVLQNKSFLNDGGLFTLFKTTEGLGGGFEPQITLELNTTTPADNDEAGIEFIMLDSASARTSAGQISTILDDVTAGTEDSRMLFRIQAAGAQYAHRWFRYFCAHRRKCWRSYGYQTDAVRYL